MQKIIKTLSFMLLPMVVCIGIIGSKSIISMAHNAYYIGMTIDTATNEYKSVVIYEPNEKANPLDHAEMKANILPKVDLINLNNKTCVIPNPKDYSSLKSGIGKTADSIMNNNVVSTINTWSQKLGLLPTPSNSAQVGEVTFPPYHDGNVDADGNDEAKANFCADTLTTSLNEAMNWACNITYSGKSGQKRLKDLTTVEAEQLAVDFSNAAETNGTITINGKTISCVAPTADIDSIAGYSKSNATNLKKTNIINVIDGLSYTDYIILTYGDEVLQCPYRVDKGYYPDSANKTSNRFSDDYLNNARARSSQYLNWQLITLEANYNIDELEITYSNFDKITKPSWLTKIVAEFLDSTLSSLRQLLGLYSLTEIMLNKGQRAASYHYGIMNESWMLSAKLLNFVCKVLALMIISGALIKILATKNMSTMVTSMRVNLMESFKDLILTVVLLFAFPLFFETLALLNYKLVDLFTASSQFSLNFGSTQTMNTGLVGAIIINIAMFILTVYFNVQYVLRAITVALFYGIAPLCIVTIAFGGKTKQIFSEFIKQLISNIYVQTFHAILISFFMTVTSTGSFRTFEMIVVLYSFIPLTSFIKHNILGIASGVTDGAGAVVSGAAAFTGGVFSGALSGKEPKTGGAGGGGGGSNNAVNNAINKRTPSKADNNELFDNSLAHKNTTDATGNASTNPKSSSNLGGKSVMNKNQAMTKSALGIAGNVAKNLGMASISGGMMLAGASMGQQGMIGSGANMMKNSMQKTANSVKGGLAGINESKEFKESGINNIVDQGSRLTAVTDMEKNGNDFMFMNDNGEESSLNNTEYADNIRQIAHDFESGDGKAIEFYNSQGIDDIGVTKDNQLYVAYNKQKIQQRRDFTPADIGYMKLYESEKNKTNSTKNSSTSNPQTKSNPSILLPGNKEYDETLLKK